MSESGSGMHSGSCDSGSTTLVGGMSGWMCFAVSLQWIVPYCMCETGPRFQSSDSSIICHLFFWQCEQDLSWILVRFTLHTLQFAPLFRNLWRFDMDPDPRIRSTGLQIRIQLFSSLSFKTVPPVSCSLAKKLKIFFTSGHLESHWRIEQDSERDPYPN